MPPSLIKSATNFSLDKALQPQPAGAIKETPENSGAVATPPLPIAPSKPSVGAMEMPKAHVGSIFEEKLGDAFRLKSGAAMPSQVATPVQASAAIPKPPIPPSAKPTVSTPPAPKTPSAPSPVGTVPMPANVPSAPSVEKKVDPYRETV